MQMDQATMEDYKNAFTVSSFREDLAQYFPLIHKIMHEAGEVDLEEFVGEGKDSTCEGCGMAESKCECLAEGLHPMVIADVEKLATLSPTDRYSAYSNIRGYFKADPELSKMASDLMGGYYEADMLRGKYKTDAAKAKYAELEPMNQAFIKQALGQTEGLGGAVAGGVGGALLTKTPSGAMAGAELGSDAEDAIKGFMGKSKSAAESIEDFVEWADRVEEGRLEPDTLAQLKELIDGGLTLDEAGRSAIDALQGIGIFDDELEAALEELSKVNPDADPKDTILAWLDKDDPEAAKEFGYKGTAQPADAGEKMPTEDMGGMTPSVREVAEMVYSFFDRETGKFPKGKKGVEVHVGKELGEEAGALAKQLVDHLQPDDYMGEEGPDMDQIPAYVRKQKQQSQQTAQTATDKRNEKAGAKVWNSPRTNESPSEGYDPVEQDYKRWEQALYPHGNGASAFDLIDGDETTIRNILTYVKQNRAVLGNEVSPESGRTVKDAIINIRNEFPQLYQAAQKPEASPEDSTFEAIMRLVNYKK
jgi:hypothetical protein